jgi:hypothetical protein
MNYTLLKPLFTLFAAIFQLTVVSAVSFFISTEGSDSNPGSFMQPYASIEKAVGTASAGDTIWIRGGVYSRINPVVLQKSGNLDHNFHLYAFPGERPILDFSGQELEGSSRGISLKASYWHIKGLEVRGAGDNGMMIEGGHYNIIENCAFYRNRDSGLQMGKGSSNNKVINCDSYYNADPTDYADADGFAAKLDVGSENYYYGCRAWKNCDDGWDGYLRGADNVSTILENCWAFENGYLEDGSDPGLSANGNGFKMGGSDDKILRHDYYLSRCLAFNNKAKGFDQNSNMGTMVLYNCTGYNNGGDNYKIYKELEAGEKLEIKNCLEYGEKLDIGSFAIQEANSWMPGFLVTDDDFLSLDPSAAYGPRKPDGSLPDILYMNLAEGSDLIDAGVSLDLPYQGVAPDIGCFERRATVGMSSAIPFAINVHVYPNPASDLVFIRLIGIKGPFSISLHDLSGKEILNFERENDDEYNELPMNISGFQKGLYLLGVRHEGVVRYLKLVVE